MELSSLRCASSRCQRSDNSVRVTPRTLLRSKRGKRDLVALGDVVIVAIVTTLVLTRTSDTPARLDVPRIANPIQIASAIGVETAVTCSKERIKLPPPVFRRAYQPSRYSSEYQAAAQKRGLEARARRRRTNRHRGDAVRYAHGARAAVIARRSLRRSKGEDDVRQRAASKKITAERLPVIAIEQVGNV